MIQAGTVAFEAREERSDASLADLYDSYLMSSFKRLGSFNRLQKANNALDVEVDRAFGASRQVKSLFVVVVPST